MSEDGEDKPISSTVLGKLPRFDGNGNITSFIKTINKRGTLEQWTDDNKADVLRYLCSGAAEVFIDSNPELEECDFKELCDSLKNRFKTKLTTSEAYAELLSIRQNRQSVTNYAESIERSAANLSDAIEDLKDQDKRNELLISVFMTGLDSHLKRGLVAREFDDFSTLIHTAKQCEATFTDRRHVNAMSSEPTVQAPQDTRYNERNPPRANPVCWNCGNRGHISRHCRSAPGQGNRHYNDPSGSSYHNGSYNRSSQNAPYYGHYREDPSRTNQNPSKNY